MKPRYLLPFVVLVLILTGSAALLVRDRRAGGGASVHDGAAATAALDVAGKARAHKAATLPPPRFRPPALANVRMLPAAREDSKEHYALALGTPDSDWDGPVPLSLIDVPAATVAALGHSAERAEVNLAFLAALQHCIPSNLRGAMVVDLWFDNKAKATKADVEATTLPPEHDKMLTRCVAEAHVGRYLLPDPDPEGSVFPMIVQLPIRNTDVYRRLATMGDVARSP